MPTMKQQAITGVSPNYETVIEDVYPSIAATGIGQALNGLYECVPFRIWGIKLSHVFALVTAPIGALVYLLMKAFGSRYVVTNRSVRRMSAIGFQLMESVPLTQIAEVTIDPDSRQTFYRTGDIRLSNAGGDTLLLLRGIPYPERFQQVILETRDAKNQTAAALAMIQARR